MNRINAFSLSLFVIVIAFIFRNWFTPTLIAGGDWVYYTPAMVKDTTFLAGWDDRYSGIGNNKIVKLPLEMYFIGTMKLSQGIDWRWYERIFWFFPFLLFSVSSSFFLAKKVLRNPLFALIASFIYSANSYSLMLIGGGQNGVALAYSFLPFLVLTYLNLLENTTSLFASLLFTLSLSVLMLFDIRIVYVAMPLLALATLVNFLFFFPKNSFLKRFLYLVIIPSIVAFGLHAFWILPLLFDRGSAVGQFGEVYTGIASVKFFSFAFLENALGLLHPNWPDNIFGKVAFMKPEFLIYPLIAFGSLLFVKPFSKSHSFTEKKQYSFILLFLLSALLGIFLSKGANDPFGGIYLWFFNHIPGFVLFRDPTKWYMIIAISYSVLIPFCLESLYSFLQSKTKISNFKFQISNKYINFQNIVLLLVFSLVLFTIRQAFTTQLSGTFKPHTVPQEYKKLEAYLSSQKSFSRSLWIPNFQRFSSFTSQHPEIPAEDYFGVASISGVLDTLSKEDAEEKLQNASVKYVVVPYDSEGELFLDDRKYSEKVFKDTVASVSALPYLSEISGFGNIHVFELKNVHDHFWTKNSFDISYEAPSPTEYVVRVNHAVQGDRLIFSEAYDRGWKAAIGTTLIDSKPFGKSLTSFVLPQTGSYTLKVFYRPQQWVDKGVVISILSLVLLLGLLAFSANSWFGQHKMIE